MENKEKMNKADKIILGNIITMDEHKPYAEAVAVRDGKIMYVGAAKVAKALSDDHTEILDYGKNYVYPGFLESHCHPGLAGVRAIAQANLLPGESVDAYVQIMKDYMEANPDKNIYLGSGWFERDKIPEAKYLDAICPDKPMVLQSGDGHSMWLNSAAMKEYGINEEAAKELGAAQIRVYEDGRPTGYISERPVMEMAKKIVYTMEEMQSGLLWFQDYLQSFGFVAAGDDALEILTDNEAVALQELEKSDKLTMRFYGGSMVSDNNPEPEKEVERIAAMQKEMNGEYFKIIGAKCFADGVVEAHTGWLDKDYADQPGYTGVKRWCDHDLMVRLINSLSEHGMNVHVHTDGDGASKCWVDAIAESEEHTGNFDMRNTLVHLHVVRPDYIQKFADYNIVACSGLMWCSKSKLTYPQDIRYMGEERAVNSYPGKSFLDAGAVLVNHSDYPVTPVVHAALGVYMASERGLPGEERNPEKEAITRYQALQAITTNVAYMWHEEDRMGSLEIGKLANLTVYAPLGSGTIK